MIATAINQPTINLNNSSKYYRKLSNTTLRIKIHGEERVTAKDIYLDALTCREDWLFTTKNIADRWSIPLKTARQKMTLLSNSGLARHEKITDPKDGKIMMHIWVFFETPLPPKEGHWVYDGTKRKNNKNTTLPTAPKKGAVVPYIKETTIKQTTPRKPPAKSPPEKPQKPPQKSEVVVALQAFVKDEKLRAQFTGKTYQALKAKKLTDGQIKTLITEVNAREDIESLGWLINRVKNIEDVSSIADFDEIEKARVKREKKNKAILDAREKSNQESNQKNEERLNAHYDKYVKEFMELKPGYKKLLYDRIVSRCLSPEFREQMISLGIDRFWEVPTARFAIQRELRKCRP